MSFEPLENSDAARAMAEIAALDLKPTDIGAQVSPTLDKYGVSPERQIDIIETLTKQAADRSPGDMSELAEDAVGRAVADPRVAGEKAKQTIKDAESSMTDDELAKLAVKAAGDEAERAGASREAAEEQAQKNLDQGMSPAMAAQAAATVTAARANNFAAGFEIFGYLDAVVKGAVIENNLNDEEKTVTNKTFWDIGASLIQVSNNDLTINCRKYHALADHDISFADWARNTYSNGYEMTSPNPKMLTAFGASAALLTNGAYIVSASGTGYRYARPLIGDFYGTFLAVSYSGDSKPNTERREVKARLLDIYSAREVHYTVTGTTESLEASEAAKALDIVLAAGAINLGVGTIAVAVGASDASASSE